MGYCGADCRRLCDSDNIALYVIIRKIQSLFYQETETQSTLQTIRKRLETLCRFSPPHQTNSLLVKGYSPTSFPLSFLWVVAFLWFRFPFLERSPSYENKKKTVWNCRLSSICYIAYKPI